MVDDKLLKEIEKYCEVNGVNDIKSLINKMLKRGFTIEKFGDLSNANVKAVEVKSNKYLINIKVEEEVVVEEITTIKPDLKVKIKKDIYGE